MNIQINEHFKLTSDPLNIVLEQSYQKKREDEYAPIEIDWRKIGYYSSFEKACKAILGKTINQSDADTLYELLNEIKKVESEIITAIKNNKSLERV